MPTIVTASELRAVLGVSSSLYSDSYLNDIIDTSENLILPMLVTYSTRIEKVKLTDNVAYYQTSTIHEFSEGQSVVVTGCGSPFNATVTVTNDLIEPYVFTAAITNITSVEIFQARTAAGGQIEGVDFTVSPFRLGRSLFNRISGILGAYIDTETMIG